MSARTRAAAVTLLFVALAAAFAWRSETRELHHRSERRSVVIVEELLRSGEWLAPTYAGRVRLQKPPLYYWVGAAAAAVSPLPTHVTLRGVSALAALGLVALVLAWGARLPGTETGLWSAASLVAMAQLWSSATLATADMLLALLSTAALFALERRRLPWLALLFALAFLTKATAALVNVLAPLALWIALTGSWRELARPRVLAWAGLAAVASLAWYGLVLALVPEAAARLREFLLVPLGAGHSDLASDHYHPVWWYAPRVLAASAPAVLLLPLVVRDGVRSSFWREAPPLRFLAASALALFVAWSLVPQKGRHYLLPILPLFALLCGASVSGLLRGRASPRA